MSNTEISKNSTKLNQKNIVMKIYGEKLEKHDTKKQIN